MDKIALPQASRLIHMLRAHHIAKDALVGYVRAEHHKDYVNESGQWVEPVESVAITEDKLFNNQDYGPYWLLNVAMFDVATKEATRRIYDSWRNEIYGIFVIGGYQSAGGVTLVDVFSLIDMMPRVVVIDEPPGGPRLSHLLGQKTLLMRLVPLLGTDLWVISGGSTFIAQEMVWETCGQLLQHFPFYNHTNPKCRRVVLEQTAKGYAAFVERFGTPLVVDETEAVMAWLSEFMGEHQAGDAAALDGATAIFHPLCGLSFESQLSPLVRFLEGDEEAFTDARDFLSYFIHNQGEEYPRFMEVLVQTHREALDKHTSRLSEGVCVDAEALMVEFWGMSPHHNDPRWAAPHTVCWTQQMVQEEEAAWRKALAARGPLKFGTMRPKRDRKKKKGKAKKRR